MLGLYHRKARISDANLRVSTTGSGMRTSLVRIMYIMLNWITIGLSKAARRIRQPCTHVGAEHTRRGGLA